MSKKPGLSLLDLGKLTETIKIGDQEIEVTGITMKDIFGLLQRFPDTLNIFSGSPVAALAKAPDTIAAVIAASTGDLGDEAAEAVAAALPIESQLDILEAIGRMTFRNGFGPFVNRLVGMVDAANAVAFGSSGRATDTNSQPQSKPSSPPDTAAEVSGN